MTHSLWVIYYRDELIAKYNLVPEGLKKKVIERPEPEKTNLDLYLDDVTLIIKSTERKGSLLMSHTLWVILINYLFTFQRLQRMDKGIRKVNSSIHEFDKVQSPFTLNI